MRVWVACVTLLGGLSAAPGAIAEGSADAGASKAGVCAACHGPDGNSSNGEWPNLAGQHASYIVEQLRKFKSGERNNPIMMPLVQGLSDQDMADIGAYFESQKLKGLEADPSYWEAGSKLYRGGDPAKQLPACIACHGPLGRGNAPALYPALRSQQAVYTQKQLTAYAAGTRYTGNAPSAQAKVMMTVAKRMSAEDIRNVASYLQGMR
jgi:cytochrome c553